jgi:hypothetical protein
MDMPGRSTDRLKDSKISVGLTIEKASMDTVVVIPAALPLNSQL